MAWTSPLTAVANATLTAAQWNASVRDNLNETAPAKATTSGRLLVTTGLNSIAEREFSEDLVTASETTASTSYTDLTTAGPTLSLTTGPAAFYMLTAQVANDTAGAQSFAAVDISGASVITPDDGRALINEGGEDTRATVVQFESNLTSGSNTFKLQYRVNGGTGTFQRRRIAVLAL